MNEEEIINILTDDIVALNVGYEKYEEAVQGLLDLYNKEKEKNRQTLEYIEREEINSIGTPFTYTQIGKNIKRKLKGE